MARKKNRDLVTLELSVGTADAILSAVSDQLITLLEARATLREVLEVARPIPQELDA